MNRTKIETADYSWNPLTGCHHGCIYCYAERLFEKKHGKGSFRRMHWHPEKLDTPDRVSKPSVIMVVSMGDLMGDWVPRIYIEDIIQVIRRNPLHVFQLFTKNPGRYREFKWPPNAFLGATVTGQLDYRAAAMTMSRLRSGGCHWISVEPYLERIELKDWLPGWIVIGALTGMVKKPPSAEDVQVLTDQAVELDIPVFHKKSIQQQVGPQFALKEFPAPAPRKWMRQRKRQLWGEQEGLGLW